MGRKRIADYIIAFLLILSLNFFLPRLLPGDPLTAIYGQDALAAMSAETEAKLVQQLGLDKSLGEQFAIYLAGLVEGDLGYSYYFQAPVTQILKGALPWTLLLVVTALVIATFLGFALGLESGWRRGRMFDKGLLTCFMFFNGFPDFVVGLFLLLIFSVALGIFPLAGALTPYGQLAGIDLVIDVLYHLILPLTALVITEVASCYLLTRSIALTVLGEPFILTARAKGIKPVHIKYKHLGRNSLLPVITRTGVRLGRLFTGALFIETIFTYPGIGLLIYRAVLFRDYALIQGVFFVVAAVIILINFVLELSYQKIDPRVKNHAY
ncbi:MAG: ABC transporter permease [Peptococcaceae bacterium]